MSRDTWLAEIAAARARMAPAGVTPRETMRALSGLEFLRSMLDGRNPSSHIGTNADFVLYAVDRGHAVFRGVPSERFLNPLGTVHGGWVSALLDSCMACAVQSTLDAGFGYTTAELKVNFVRPITAATGPVEATGRVIHAGRQIGTGDGRLVDADGKLLAHGSTTCLVFPI